MRVIDSWVNAGMAGPPTSWQVHVAKELFKRPVEDVFRKVPADELIAMMDAAGVEKAIVTLTVDKPDVEVLKYAEQYPDRLAYSALVDPRQGMNALRKLEGMAKAKPIRLARVIPCTIDLPPNDRVYYPLYAKCVELGLPISINTGLPGPPLPGRCQDPIHLDDVCLFFPELTIVMANGADPWWPAAIALMAKYPKLHLMTSAFAPKYLPEALIHYMNTRGATKVLFATDFPFLTMERCIGEAKALALGEGVLDQYLYTNAERLFFRR
jgi:predicted TIM-barrel fold metal-dependent hydrolase